jgi:hypothetical protein
VEAANLTDAQRVDYSMTAGKALPVAVRAAGSRPQTAAATWTPAAVPW